MIFQNLTGPGKSRCDVPNGINQEWACPFSAMDSGAWR